MKWMETDQDYLRTRVSWALSRISCYATYHYNGL